MLVTIYTETNLRGPAKRSGAGMWLVEYIRKDGTPETRQGMLYAEESTENAMTLELINEALSILTKKCSVLVVTRCEHVLNTTRNYWLEQWEKRDWLKSNGKPVANREQWEQIYEYMQIYEVLFDNGENSYRNVMMAEIEKRLKEEL